MHHSPFSYNIFASQMVAAIQVPFVSGRRLIAKKAKRRQLHQSAFFSFDDDDSCNKKDTVFLLEDRKKVHTIPFNLLKEIRYTV